MGSSFFSCGGCFLELLFGFFVVTKLFGVLVPSTFFRSLLNLLLSSSLDVSLLVLPLIQFVFSSLKNTSSFSWRFLIGVGVTPMKLVMKYDVIDLRTMNVEME